MKKESTGLANDELIS